MNFFDIDSPLSRFLIKLFDLVLLNVCFVLCALPVVTVGASLTALHTAVPSLGKSGVLARFFKAFAANFKQSTAIFLILLAAGALLALSFWFVSAAPPAGAGFVKAVLYLSAYLVIGTASFAFPLLSRFENSVLGTLKNAFVFAVFSVPAVVLITAAWVFPAVFLFFSVDLFLLALYVWMFVGFSLSAYMESRILDRIFRRIMGGQP